MRTSRVILAALLVWVVCFVPVIHGGSIIQSAYRTIQDEGVALAIRAVVNFTGAGVTCADNGVSGRTDCTIPGGVTSAYGTVQNNGSGLTARAILNFIGASCVDNAGATRTDCTITSSVTSVFGLTGAVANLSGDCTTSGSAVVTCTKVNGVSQGPYGGIGSAAGQYVAPSTQSFSSGGLGSRDSLTQLSDGSEVLFNADVNQGNTTSALHTRMATLPVTPWTVSVCWSGVPYRSDATAAAGLALSDGTKYIVASTRTGTATAINNVEGWTTSANGSGTTYGVQFESTMGVVRCQRISDNGTSRKYFVSNDGGLTWWSPSSNNVQANTTFLTATQWGYVLATNNGNYSNMIHVVHASISASVCGALFTALGSPQVLTTGPTC